jgi:hypothetical protein
VIRASSELGDELAPAVVDELVELPLGESPHEVLVLTQALRCDEPHQQAALIGVLGRVHARQLVTERKDVAVLLDQLADVVTFERHRKAGKRRVEIEIGVVVE